MSRETSSTARGDVPLGIVVALVIVLVALFVPVVHRTPAWPTNLPPLSYDADATIHEQRADLRRAPPPAAREVDYLSLLDHARPRTHKARTRPSGS
jgi:hypothetical protein